MRLHSGMDSSNTPPCSGPGRRRGVGILGINSFEESGHGWRKTREAPNRRIHLRLAWHLGARAIDLRLQLVHAVYNAVHQRTVSRSGHRFVEARMHGVRVLDAK